MIDIINCITTTIILATNIQIKRNDIQNQLVTEPMNETKKETDFFDKQSKRSCLSNLQ